MKNYRITFIHNGSKYSFIKSISEHLSEYVFRTACRTEIRTYMNKHNLLGNYTLVDITEV